MTTDRQDRTGTDGPLPRESSAVRAQPPRILLCVTGSIAAYKAAQVARSLLKEGMQVDVVMSHCAQEFVGKTTFLAITGRPVHTEMFGDNLTGESHVSLAQAADLIVVAPATADRLARMAQGRADDLMAALLLCTQCPILLAPAMHPAMWAHPATRRNVEQLRAQPNVTMVGPMPGEVASGDVGLGRMAEPEDIVEQALALLSRKDLLGRHVLVTAGPTLEDIDPVRFLGNRSSGTMGFAIARCAARRGARTTLVAGPVQQPTPVGVERIDVRTALQMQSAIRPILGEDLNGVDALIMAAAVSDFRPAEARTTKLVRELAASSLTLRENPDILAEIGAKRRAALPVLVGFAVETGSDDELVRRAREKLIKKRTDLIVANRADEALGRPDNRAFMVTDNDSSGLGVLPKPELASRIIDFVIRRLQEVG